MSGGICEAMSLVAEYATKQGWIPIGFRAFDVGDWTVTVNGTRQEREGLKPFQAKAENNNVIGILIFDAFGGVCGGYRDVEEEFCNAMRAAVKEPTS